MNMNKFKKLTVQQYFLVFFLFCLILHYVGPPVLTIQNFVKSCQNSEYYIINTGIAFFAHWFYLYYKNAIISHLVPGLFILISGCCYGCLFIGMVLMDYENDDEFNFKMYYIYSKNQILFLFFTLLMDYTGFYLVIASFNFINIIVLVIIPVISSIFIIIRYHFYNKQMLISFGEFLFLIFLIAGSLEIYNYWSIL